MQIVTGLLLEIGAYQWLNFSIKKGVFPSLITLCCYCVARCPLTSTIQACMNSNSACYWNQGTSVSEVSLMATR